MANAASPSATPIRSQPLAGGPRSILSPVRWGWLALVAGAHAAGLGLLANGAGEPRSSAAPASATTISVRMIGVAPESAAEKSLPAIAEKPVAAAVQAPVPSHPAPQGEVEPRKVPRAPAKTVRSRRSEAPATAASARQAAAKAANVVPPPSPAAQATTTALAAPRTGEAAPAPAVEPAQAPPNASPAATTLHDNAPALPPEAASAAAPEGSQALAAAAAPLLPARHDAAYLNNPKPSYPVISRRMGEQGKVLLRVRVMRDGLPQDVEIIAASGSPRLDRAAADAVRGWKFAPARQGDDAVDSWLRVPIVFRLDD